MLKKVWCKQRATLYIGIIKVYHISPDKNYIKFKGCLCYRRGSKLKNVALEVKTYKMPLDKYNQLYNLENGEE